MIKTNFVPNATISKVTVGESPYIVGCDTRRVQLPVGHRVQILEVFLGRKNIVENGIRFGVSDTSRCAYRVRCQDPINPRPGCFWELVFGDPELAPANDRILLDV